MARDTGDEGGNGNRSAEEAALSARLQSLGERLAQQKGPGPQAEARSGSKSDPSALARGFRSARSSAGRSTSGSESRRGG